MVSRETLDWIQYTLEELQELKETLLKIKHHEVYSSIELVTDPQGDILYLVGPKADNASRYEEYVYLTHKKKFVKVGDVLIDLSGYVTTETLNNTLAGYATTAHLTEVINVLQGQINELVASMAAVSLGVSPEVVFVGEESNIALYAMATREATSIKIKREGAEIASGEGVSLSVEDTFTPSVSGPIYYQAEFTIAGFMKTAAKIVEAVYPVFYGAGQSYADATSQVSPRTTPAGTYHVEIANDGDSVFFLVPRSIPIGSAKMNGFDFPLQAPVEVEIDGVEYKYYQSANTYNAGTLNIVIS